MPLPTDTPATAPSPPRYFWEDFPVGQVREFGAYLVTREAVLAFAREFDPQPFHIDDAAAEASLFGRLAASGWHTCAMAMRMMCDAYLLESASLGSPGLEKLSWKKPVYPGDTLHVRGRISEKTPSRSRPEMGSFRTVTTVTNQDDQVVMTFTSIVLIRRRPESD